MDRGRKVIAAKVIPWENQYGIALVFERGNHLAYPVGDREEAERQVQLALNQPSEVTRHRLGSEILVKQRRLARYE
jgi:hypothetical protein